ncbi:NADH dehydrogenase [ubiquinone] 1 alpha subcomplex subunit 5-like [Hypanus sabinus]|uniref:NADH dehydrogenase [ubiquinone] 1 alpha subcomplex subunit 5-like n=1 Tax=Hypanus sabinus TaxID=79690 RepID=UPI0028C46A7F|nr:NADH dehydrogenase [ubiquinone] 1 alpha subcomplex subunit 5-like [Hypanus sabinus]
MWNMQFTEICNKQVVEQDSQYNIEIQSTAAAKAGVLKKTTGLVGLAVAQNPLEQLKILYTRVLTVLESIPPEAAYRKYTEQIINERFNMIKTENNIQKIEDKINCGQIEEIISQAESELSLAKKMAKWKPWEPLIEEAPHNQWKWPI